MKKDNVISITRVIAMLSIILCHLCKWQFIPVLQNVFNVGIEIFLLISGMLYANKKIDKPVGFMTRRWLKICLPLYILLFCMIIVRLFMGNAISLEYVLMYLLNCQGLDYLFIRLNLPSIGGMGPLWFLTVIMACYILLVIVKRFEKDSFWASKKKVGLAFGLGILFTILFAFLGIQLGYFLVFMLGYAIGRCGWRIDVRRYGILTLAMFLGLITRIATKTVLDGTVLYNDVIAIFTHIILAVWIYGTIRLYGNRKGWLVKRISDSRVMVWLDKYSFGIYMVHYLLLFGLFSVGNIPANIAVQLLVFCFGTVVLAVLLEWLTKCVVSYIICKRHV